MQASAYGVTVDKLSDVNSAKDTAWLMEQGGLEGLSKGICTDLVVGLVPGATGSASIEAHQEVFGPNKFKEVPPKPIYKIMLDNMKDPILLLLVFAAAISTIVGSAVPEQREHGEYVEGIAIWIAVLAVNFIGSYNDWQKDQQFRKLNAQKDNIQVTVIRNKSKILINNHDVVVGDLLCLDTGNKVVADGVVIESQGLTLDEASLTGESDPIKKNPPNLDNPKNDPWVRSGTQVSEGSGVIMVTAVGVRSEWGKTMALVAQAGDDWTPLQRKLGIVAGAIGKIGFTVAISCFIILLVKWCVANNGFPLDKVNEYGPIQFFMYSVTIIVVSIPEGLPLAVTIALAYAMKKMMKDQNFVRVLSACETMGGATTICSDKTGTLTENRMTVTEGWFAGAKLTQTPTKEELPADLVQNLQINIAMSSKAFLIESANDKVEFVGNRTECALLMLIRSWGINIPTFQEQLKPSMVKLFGFSSARKMSSVVMRHGDGFRLFNKGAAEWVLARCTTIYNQDGSITPMTDTDREMLNKVVADMARRGLRCICLTYANFPPSTPLSFFEESEDCANDLTCMTIVGIKDPVRKEVPAAVETCKRAGITVRMVTGDNIDTARHIARECGILYDEKFIAMEGKDFRAQVDNPDFILKLPNLRVLARSSPEDKLTLVSLLKKQGQVVAVTGDGTNDAPALKESDVGLAMGIAGTEVAKEAADIVILDDNFSSIVKSVLWGRSVFNSIRKFLQFQLTVNFVALVIAFVGAVSGGIEPLNVLQLLWVNLIMDTMGALALATESPTLSLLDDRPYDRSEPLITRRMAKHVILQGCYQLFWLFVCLYGLPVLFDRYKVGTKQDYFDIHCEGALRSNKMKMTAANATMYCDVITHCGFPYRVESRNTTACPLYVASLGMGVPRDLKLAMCMNGTSTCHMYNTYNSAKKYLDDEAQKQKYKDYEGALSVLFNAFIMMQVFNEICARRIKDEFTILNGVLTSPTFMFVIIVTIGFQVIIMQTPIGMFFKVVPLDYIEWLSCIAIGLGMIPMSFATRGVTRIVEHFMGSNEGKPQERVPKKGEVVPIDDSGNSVSLIAAVTVRPSSASVTPV